MILSMTGYGRATKSFGEKSITVEIRSLNSKYTDVRLKIPQNYKEREHLLRKLLTDQLKRGKIEVNIEVDSMQAEDENALNHALIKKYYQELSQISQELNATTDDLMAAILRIPNVVVSAQGTMSEEEWKTLQATIDEAIAMFDHFRTTEGTALENELAERVKNIQSALDQVDPFEEERVASLRARLKQRMDEHTNKEDVDESRFEQEVLYYIEKIDLTEEKVRLAQHCKFFLEEMNKKGIIKGRKLGFISQEIGREINTMGAKAYSHGIQRLVVSMKDELEKIKEQVANIV